MSALGLWLELSRTNLISFRLSHASSGYLLDPRLAQVLTALIHHFQRWKDVSFEMQSSSIELLWHIFPDNLTALRSISAKLQGLWQAPSEIQAPVVPWRHLTALNLSFDYEQLPTLDKCMDILTQCDNLLKCTMNADCVFDSKLTEKVALPRLNHFELILQSGPQIDHRGYTAGSSLMSFLEQLELPNLPSFSLQWVVRRNAWAWSAEDQARLISFIASLAPTLHSLNLAYLPLSDQDVLRCLQPLQGLSHLDLRFSLADKEHDPITDAFLDVLSTDQPSSNYLPALQSLHLQSNGGRCTCLRVIDLIKSRWKPISGDPPQLRLFELVSLVPISTTKTRETLRAWKQEGLDVAIDQVLIR
ncbi:hypothetical protein C0991_011571 [Blastosporella zonata]|nr:hypothetical protein C0991_011571 [Blastosporella zonata]